MPWCKRCGAKIRYVKTKAGKVMPVDWSVQEFIQDELYGKERILLTNGEMISCRFLQYGEEETGTGFVPHFATCEKG